MPAFIRCLPLYYYSTACVAALVSAAVAAAAAVEQVFQQEFLHYSREYYVKAIADGRITVNGVATSISAMPNTS